MLVLGVRITHTTLSNHSREAFLAKKSVIKLNGASEGLQFGGTVLMTEQSKHEVVYTSFGTGGQIILDGEGLKVKTGQITAGTVTGLTITDPDGKEVMELSGLHIKATSLDQSSVGAIFGQIVLSTVIKSNIIIGSKASDTLEGQAGNDVIKGRGGDDEIAGGTGKDVLFGGGGADQFGFAVGDGKDKIMDFDADGSDGSQDLIYASMALVDKKTVHGNAVLDFGNGDTLTLIGVRANEIDATDFAI